MEVEAKLNEGMEDCLSAFYRHRIKPDTSPRDEGGESRDVTGRRCLTCREHGQAKPEAHTECSFSSTSQSVCFNQHKAHPHQNKGQIQEINT